jgi:hypothetical protein
MALFSPLETSVGEGRQHMLEQQTAIAFGGNCISADGLRDLIADARTSFARALKRRNAR